jgi:hypothetical protein
MVAGWTGFGLLVFGAIALPVLKHSKFKHFDPNLEDQSARIAVGKSRAITRAELEKARQAEGQNPSES